MNKFLKIIGGLSLLIVVGGTIAVAVFYFKSFPLKESATVYFNQNIPLIVESWDSKILAEKLIPEISQQDNIDNIREMFSELSKLGKMEKLENPDVQITTGAYPNTPHYGIWATCDAEAQFASGAASIRMVLKRNDDSWLVAGFHVVEPL